MFSFDPEVLIFLDIVFLKFILVNILAYSGQKLTSGYTQITFEGIKLELWNLVSTYSLTTLIIVNILILYPTPNTITRQSIFNCIFVSMTVLTRANKRIFYN